MIPLVIVSCIVVSAWVSKGDSGRRRSSEITDGPWVQSCNMSKLLEFNLGYVNGPPQCRLRHILAVRVSSLKR